jgi:hypothetical protein
VRPGPGRPPEYCRQSHRQRDFEARRRAAKLGQSEAELVFARDRVDVLLDHVFLLECTLADLERDLADDDSPEALRRALASALEAARPLAADRKAFDERSRPEVDREGRPGRPAEPSRQAR